MNTAISKAVVPLVPNGEYTQINYFQNTSESEKESKFCELQQKSTDINLNLHKLILKQEDEIHKLKGRIESLISLFNIKQEAIEKTLVSLQSQIQKTKEEIKNLKPGELSWEIYVLRDQDSDSFFSSENGYKMRLKMHVKRFIVESYLYFKLEMAQTANNNNLQWPNEFDIRVGIVNQSNGKFLISEKQVILFQCPKSIHETSFTFIDYNWFSKFWFNDMMLVKCFVN